ncbi:MAG: hypothetical protein M0R74_00875 [Dehalococcoidia bacterium]|nr:hypothetical protein [Dehalococcoidia bacterium]
MPTVSVGDMDIIFSNYHREPTGVPGMELLTLDLTYRLDNLRTTEPQLPPLLEVRDNLGNVFTPVLEDTPTEPLNPGDSVRANPRFEISVHSQKLDVVVAPGTAAEAHIELT